MKFWTVLDSWGCREKKTPPNRHKCATFCGQKKSLKIKKYFSIRAEKLHSIKAKNKLKHFGQYFFLKKVCNTQRALFNRVS